MRHWKEDATRCAVVGCERQRAKGWSTCSLRRHYRLGRRLAGAGRIEPIELLEPDMPALEERLIEHYRGDNPGRAFSIQPLEQPGAPGACRNCGGVDGCYPGCTDHD